ncbi:MAG TPA: tetratricopeptide repeat protein [Terracidiphilus sp.]|nr:tetratricopeptide repeat protein [Terracidiphilus sp.]
MRPLILLLSLATAMPLARAAEPVAIEVTSPHFTVVTQAGDKQARHLLDNFERMRWMFHTLFPKIQVDPEAPMVVIAARNRKEFQSVEPAAYLAKGQIDLAGYFTSSSDRNYILLRLDANTEHPFSTVFHEYTHLMFRDAQGWMPLWLNEGMAEFYQNTDFHDKEVFLGQTSVDDLLYLRQNSLIPLTTLLRVDHKSPYYHDEQKGSVFYAESWALTHYLQVTDNTNKTNRIHDYLVRMSQHEDPVTAAQEAFGDLRQLQNNLAAYIAGAQYTMFVMNSAAAPIDAAAYKERVLSPAEFDADRADVLAHVGRVDEARAMLDRILGADKTLPGPRATMGFLAWRNGSIADAATWYGQAVALGSRDLYTNFLFAQLSIREGAGDEDGRIEKSLRTAIEVNPDFAPAYNELSVWLVRQGGDLDEAQRLAVMAVQLKPDNVYFRLNAANVQMKHERYDDAIRVLEGAAKIATTDTEKAMIEERLRQAEAAQSSLSVMARVQRRDDDAAATGATTETGTTTQVVTVDAPPRHPVEPATGPKHTAVGTLRGVECSYPTYLELRVEPRDGSHAIAVYSSNFSKIELSALGFDAGSAMNPCQDFEGLAAKVVYAQGSDKSIDGQIVSIELHKR